MDNNNLCQVAKYFGHNKNYYYVLRLKSPERFNYIKNIHPNNFFKSCISYQEEMEILKNNLQDICYHLEDEGLMHKFSIYVYNKKFFKNTNSISSSFSRIVFSSKPGFHFHKTYLKYQKIIPLYNNFIKELKSS